MRHLFALAAIIVLSVSLTAFTSPVASLAQTPSATSTPEPTPTPTPDPVLEQAEREAKLADELKKKAVADKERAEAEAAKLKALVQPLGTPANVIVPTGSVTTDAAGWVEAQMLAQEAARQITRRLTRALCTESITPGAGQATAQKVKTLVIHSPSDLTGVELYGSIMGQLKNLKDELKKKNDEAKDFLEKTNPTRPPDPDITDSDLSLAFAAPGIATGVIKSVAELLNLFRTDTSFTNQAITLDENTIVSHIVRSFNSGKVTGDNCSGPIRVYHPALYTPRLLETSETSDLIKLLNEVETAKIEAAGNVEKLDARIKQLNDLSAAFKSRDNKRAEWKKKKEKELPGCNEDENPTACRKKVLAEIKALEKDIAKLDDDLKVITAGPEKLEDWVKKLTDLRAKTQGLVTATNLISAKLNTPDETTKLTALAQLLRAERLHGILKADGAYTLHVAVKANGTTKVKKNLFVDAKVRHSAGADLTYQLIEGGGVIAQGDALKCYIAYQSARNVQDMVSGTGSRRVTCNFPDDTAEPEEDQEEEQVADAPKIKKP
jgi:hypothetical protein